MRTEKEEGRKAGKREFDIKEERVELVTQLWTGQWRGKEKQFPLENKQSAKKPPSLWSGAGVGERGVRGGAGGLRTPIIQSTLEALNRTR